MSSSSCRTTRRIRGGAGAGPRGGGAAPGLAPTARARGPRLADERSALLRPCGGRRGGEHRVGDRAAQGRARRRPARRLARADRARRPARRSGGWSTSPRESGMDNGRRSRQRWRPRGCSTRGSPQAAARRSRAGRLCCPTALSPAARRGLVGVLAPVAGQTVAADRRGTAVPDRTRRAPRRSLGRARRAIRARPAHRSRRQDARRAHRRGRAGGPPGAPDRRAERAYRRASDGDRRPRQRTGGDRATAGDARCRACGGACGRRGQSRARR